MFNSSSAGFTLIELMITLVIAAILGALVLPAYQDHLLRAKIPEATSGLSLTAMRLEQYYQDHRTYANNAACGITPPVDQHFHFTCTVPQDGQSFLLTAAGVSTETTKAFTYTLDQQSNASTTSLPEGWGDVPAACWIVKRKGTC